MYSLIKPLIHPTAYYYILSMWGKKKKKQSKERDMIPGFRKLRETHFKEADKYMKNDTE